MRSSWFSTAREQPRQRVISGSSNARARACARVRLSPRGSAQGRRTSERENGGEFWWPRARERSRRSHRTSSREGSRRGAGCECARYVSAIEDTSGSLGEPLETVPPFTFKELLMLKALARFGSIKAAAEYLYVSQSSVSSQLSSLEQKIKATLVNRHPGIQGASFTEEGQLLLRYAERILTASSEAVKALEDLRNLDVGGVNLGASQTTGTYLIPRLVGSFQQKYPGVKVQLTVGSTSSICTSVANGEIDVAIVGGEVPHELMDYLQVTTYTEEEFVLILPPRHPLSMKKKIEKERLYNLAFVSLNQNSTSQKFQTQTLKENGLNPKMLHVQMEFNSIEAIKSAVQHGLGAAFVSQSAIQKEVQLGLLHSSSIQDVILTRKLQVVTNRKRYFSRAAQCFTQEILTAADWYGIQQASNLTGL